MMHSEEFTNLTVILPTLNEEGNIRPLVEEIFSHAPGSKIIVVDDSSDDRTAEIASELAAANPRVSLIARKGVRCLTKSIDEGIKAADTDFVCWMDADLSHPPLYLSQLLSEARKCGCCIASRFIGKNKSSEIGDSFLHAMLSSVLNFFIHTTLRLGTTDYTSGYIVLDRRLLHDHDLVGDYGEYFIELLYYLKSIGVQPKEIPYESPPRVWGESKTGTTIAKLMKRGLKYIAVVLRLVVSNLFKSQSKKADLTQSEYTYR